MFPIPNKCYALFQALLLLVFLAHCGKTQEEKQLKPEKGSDNRPPVIKLAKIHPKIPTVQSDIGVVVKSSDPDGDSVEYMFQWLIDKEEIPDATDDVLSKDMFQKGQEIQCIITPTDGEVDGKPFVTKPVWVANSLPVIDEIEFNPERLYPGETAQVVIETHDLDQDPVSIFCEWYLNDRSVQKGEMRFSLEDSRKKDRLFVKLYAMDGEGRGPWIQSKILTIQNRPPRILSEPPSRWTIEEGFQYRVKAMDPDGDPVRVRIEGKIPPGMVWNRETLTLTWKPREATKGSFKLRAVAEDNDGGVCTQEFTLTIS